MAPTLAVVGLALLALELLIVFRRRWLAQEHARIDAAIRSNSFRYKDAHRKADQQLPKRAQARRQMATDMRAHAAAIDSGTSVTQRPERQRA